MPVCMPIAVLARIALIYKVSSMRPIRTNYLLVFKFLVLPTLSNNLNLTCIRYIIVIFWSAAITLPYQIIRLNLSMANCHFFVFAFYAPLIINYQLHTPKG